MSSDLEKQNVNRKVYQFGEFRLHAEGPLLLCGQTVASLSPKACEVLLALVEGGGRVLSKQQIIERVWPETYVEEANLTHHISAIRKTLGEESGASRFI